MNLNSESFFISADILVTAFSRTKIKTKGAISVLERGILNNAYISSESLIEFIEIMNKNHYPIEYIQDIVKDLQIVYKIAYPASKTIFGATELSKIHKLNYKEALLIQLMFENNCSILYTNNFKLNKRLGIKIKNQ